MPALEPMPRWPSSLLPGEKENEEIRASWLSMVRGDRTPTGEAAARGGAVGASMCVELAQLRPGHDANSILHLGDSVTFHCWNPNLLKISFSLIPAF